MKTIILAAGGTGGHIFPAESLAVELQSRGYKTILITDNRYHKYSQGNKVDIETFSIRAGTLGSGIAGKVKGIFDIITGYFQAGRLLKRISPDVVIGFGGYPSFPTVYNAARNGIKTIIHEQNSMLGRANYLLAPKVDKIATSFSEVAGILDDDLGKVVMTGNPVRNSIRAVRDIEYPELSGGGVLRILVTGGSQGASIFSHVVPDAIASLPPDLRKRIRVDQQCRPDNIDEVREKYNKMGISADLSPFFSDISSRLASAHLVISRSGATTLAEVSVTGRPVIMVPYPHALDDHQTVNANALEDMGGGWLIPQGIFTPVVLAAKLESFLNLPSTLAEAACRARDAGSVNAASQLANLVESLALSGDDNEGRGVSSVLDKMESRS